jgi:hypothetical protein
VIAQRLRPVGQNGSGKSFANELRGAPDARSSWERWEQLLRILVKGCDIFVREQPVVNPEIIDPP